VEKDLPKEEEEAGVTLIKLMGVAVAAVAAAVVAVAIERPQVEFGMMEMTFVSLIHQGAHPDPATVVETKERHVLNGNPKPKCPFRPCI
jgi:hypothetical protein